MGLELTSHHNGITQLTIIDRKPIWSEYDYVTYRIGGGVGKARLSARQRTHLEEIADSRLTLP